MRKFSEISAKLLRLKALRVMGLLVLCGGVGLLGVFFVQSATRQLLEAEARIDAQQWSNYLSRNVGELRSIANGTLSDPDSISLLKRALTAGNVVSFRVYDARGALKLQSRNDLAPDLLGQQMAKTDPEFAPALAANRTTTILRNGTGKFEPAFIASALVPIKSDNHTVGWLLLNLDQTPRQEYFSTITTRASLAICILLIAAPVFGFWYHGRNRARMEQALADLSQRDQLTGLPNKSTILDRLDSEGAGQKTTLILSELTNAAAVSRMHGQQAEEYLIRLSAERLAALVGPRGQIASAGRGSFLVSLAEAGDPMSALSLARDITRALGAGAEFEGIRIASACHAGIALGPTDGATAAQLLRSAELALITARDQGTPGYGFFNPDLAKDSSRRLAVERAVARAAEARSFRLDYQPVYNIRTGELNGFEALIRLHDSELGHVSPAEFIPVAEQIGLINGIGAWALDEAARTAALWPPHLMVAVNLSPSQFLSGTLIQDVRRALENNQFPGYRLEVEITEGTLMNDSELVLGQLRVLRDMGVAVALDDFGTGYSSLSYLWKFPFSKLKIDRSFVKALDESANAKGILRSIVKLGHGLGLTVTAEGIETTKQYSVLRDMGCDLAQGYLLDRPAKTADLAGIILRNFANGLTRRSREAAASRSKTAA